MAEHVNGKHLLPDSSSLELSSDAENIDWHPCVVRLSSKHKVPMVNFWATWCPPCRKEIPSLKLVYDRFKAQGLVVLAISQEEPHVLRKFVAENGLRFPVLVAAGKKVEEEVFSCERFSDELYL